MIYVLLKVIQSLDAALFTQENVIQKQNEIIADKGQWTLEVWT